MRNWTKYKSRLGALAVLFVGTGVGASLNFALQIILARILGAEQLGVFTSALAMVTLVAPLAGFGLGGFLLSIYGEEGWHANRWISASIKFLCASTLLVVIGILSWAAFGPHKELTRSLIMILVVHIFGLVAVQQITAKLQLEGRDFLLAAWQALPNFFRVAGIVVATAVLGSTGIQVTHVALIYALTALLLTVLGAQQMWQMASNALRLEGHGAKPLEQPNQGHQPKPNEVLGKAWPFGLAGFFYLVYFQSNIIFIKYIVGDAAAGKYAVAATLMAAVYLLPSVVYQKFLLSRIHRWAHQNPSKLLHSYTRGNWVMAALGIVVTIFLVLTASKLVPIMFGQQFEESALILMVLAFAAPFRFIATSVGSPLLTRGHMTRKVAIMGSSALFNILLNASLIPMWGVTGAAIATVLTEAYVLCVYFWYFRRFLSPELAGQ